jgi:hypothetical protein
MDNSKMKEGRFSYEGNYILGCGLFTLKGSMQGKEINIVINERHKEHYININLANQLLIPEPNIIEKEDIFCRKRYEIKELQVTIDDYEYISQFNVTTMYTEEIDIILGLPWFQKLRYLHLKYREKVCDISL